MNGTRAADMHNNIKVTNYISNSHLGLFIKEMK